MAFLISVNELVSSCLALTYLEVGNSKKSLIEGGLCRVYSTDIRSCEYFSRSLVWML